MIDKIDNVADRLLGNAEVILSLMETVHSTVTLLRRDGTVAVHRTHTSIGEGVE